MQQFELTALGLDLRIEAITKPYALFASQHNKGNIRKRRD